MLRPVGFPVELDGSYPQLLNNHERTGALQPRFWQTFTTYSVARTNTQGGPLRKQAKITTLA
jgi:hypothetical protein